MITQITDSPNEIKTKLGAEVNSGWHHSQRIVAEALADVRYDIYLYTERTTEGELIALGTAEVDSDGWLEILNLATKYYRRGSGQQAVGQFKTLAESLNTDIQLTSAIEAVGFWQAMGFEIDECCYGDEENGVQMWPKGWQGG